MSSKYTRRAALAAASSQLACNRLPQPPEARVLCLAAQDYGQALFQLARDIFTELRVDLRGKRVVLKPNLVEYRADVPINTHPLLVHAVFEAALAAGAAGVRIAEGPGHRRGTLELAEAAGYFRQIPRFEDVFTDLNLDDAVEMSIPSPNSRLRSLFLPKTVRGCDLLISMPKMKTHHWVGATLSLKNYFGIVPGAIYGWPKNVLHWAGIEECIADLYTLVPNRLAIVDGITGMEGNGPIQGTAKAAGVVVAGRDQVAVDATCCRIMGLDPGQIRYLRLLESQGCLDAERIEQAGEPWRRFAADFRVLPAFEPLKRRAS